MLWDARARRALAVHDRISLIWPAAGAARFHQPYRITALFAEMHTGGPRSTGYVALALPVTAAALLRRRAGGWRTVAGLALCLGCTLFVTTRILRRGGAGPADAGAILWQAAPAGERGRAAAGRASTLLRMLAGFASPRSGCTQLPAAAAASCCSAAPLAFGLAAALSRRSGRRRCGRWR